MVFGRTSVEKIARGEKYRSGALGMQLQPQFESTAVIGRGLMITAQNTAEGKDRKRLQSLGFITGIAT